MYRYAQKIDNPSGLGTTAMLLGKAYLNQGRRADAENYLQEALQQFKKIPSLWDMIALYPHLCNALKGQGKFDETLAVLREWEESVEKRDKELGDVWDTAMHYDLDIFHAGFYSKQGKPVEAERYFNKIESYASSIDYNMKGEYLYSLFLFYNRQERYKEGLALSDTLYNLATKLNYPAIKLSVLEHKAWMLGKTGSGSEAVELYDQVVRQKDSIRQAEAFRQLDELRTVYEVDKHIMEKERKQQYLLFTITGCLLLLIALAVWIYYSLLLKKKNRTLVQQIQQMTRQQELQEQTLLEKIFPEPEDDESICPDSRKDKLCIALRTLLLEKRIYREPNLTRDSMIADMGVNRIFFIETFQQCFGTSFNEYISSLRMKEAVVLLEKSDLSMGEIAEKTGFGTTRTFQRQFRIKSGMSPMDYRKLSKEPGKPLDSSEFQLPGGQTFG